MRFAILLSILLNQSAFALPTPAWFKMTGVPNFDVDSVIFDASGCMYVSSHATSEPQGVYKSDSCNWSSSTTFTQILSGKPAGHMVLLANGDIVGEGHAYPAQGQF